jgi:biopolymer transport protein ExbD
MKLTKKSSQDDVEGDMTPMIDCVFQLIMFFILITDMSQRELEELYLPIATEADEDAPDPKLIRPVVNILSDGTIWVMKKKYYDPKADDEYAELGKYLFSMARQMPQKPLNVETGTGPLIPDNALLIRADQSTPTKYIQKVMEVCGKKGIQIWKVELAAAEESKDAKGP